MKKPHYYQELIDELKDEIGFGSLEKTEVIQILRSDKANDNGYFPIIDWYYNDETMTLELEGDSSDSKEDIKEKMLIRAQYLQDKPLLKNMSVDLCLAEMFKVANDEK